MGNRQAGLFIFRLACAPLALLGLGASAASLPFLSYVTTSTTLLRFCSTLLFLCSTALLACGQELPQRAYIGIDLRPPAQRPFLAKARTPKENMQLADVTNSEKIFECITVILRWLDRQRQA